jgi:hypothetical protein
VLQVHTSMRERERLIEPTREEGAQGGKGRWDLELWPVFLSSFSFPCFAPFLLPTRTLGRAPS